MLSWVLLTRSHNKLFFFFMEKLEKWASVVNRSLGFQTPLGRQQSFMEIDHEIFSTVILSLPLIQEGQFSVSGERMCTILVTAEACSAEVWLGKLTALNMTPLG